MSTLNLRHRGWRAGACAMLLGISSAAASFELIEIAPDGGLPDNPDTSTDTNAQISADGRYVVFSSLSTNLIPGGVTLEPNHAVSASATGFLSNGSEVYLRDRVSGTTTLISNGIDGRDGNGGSGRATISADGRFIAFRSFATNLVPGVTQPISHVYLHDTQSSTTTLLSQAAGVPGDAISFNPLVTPDGSHVVFASAATNLGTATGQQWNLYIYDMATGALSVEPNLSGIDFLTTIGGNPYGGGVFAVSGQAEKLAVLTPNALVASDTDSFHDVYVFDRTTATFSRASLPNPANSAPAGGESGAWEEISGQFSTDGNYLVYKQVQAWGEPAPFDYILYDSFLHDTQSGTTVALDSTGVSLSPSIRADGSELTYLWLDDLQNPTAAELRVRQLPGGSEAVVLDGPAMQAASADGFDFAAMGLQGIRVVPLAPTSIGGDVILFAGATEVISSGDSVMSVYVHPITSPAENTLVVTPDKTSLDPAVDTSVTVTLNAHWENLYGMQVSCTADPTVLALSGGNYGAMPGDTLTVPPDTDTTTNTWHGAYSLRAPETPYTGDITFATLQFTPMPTTGTTDVTCTALGTDQAGNAQAVTVTAATVTVDDGIHAVNGFTIAGLVTLPYEDDHSGTLVTLRLGDRTLTTTTAADGSYSFVNLRDGNFDVVYSAAQHVHECVSVSLAGETVSLASSQMIAGDLNNNGEIDIGDFTLLASSFRTSEGDADFNADADLTRDGTVNIQDLGIMASNWGFSGCSL